MSEREELAQELDGVIADCEKGNGFDDVCLRTIKRVRDALSAQPQGEPVAEIDVKNQDELCHGRFILWLKDPTLLPKGTKLYTAPPSGVREGIALQELQNIVNAKRFDVDKFDDDTDFADWAQSRARHAITRAAEQVNAEGRAPCYSEVEPEAVRSTSALSTPADTGEDHRQDEHRVPAQSAPSAPQSEQTHVRVPVEQLEHWAEYWNGSANEKAMSDALEHILGEVSDLLRAATGKESEHGK